MDFLIYLSKKVFESFSKSKNVLTVLSPFNFGSGKGGFSLREEKRDCKSFLKKRGRRVFCQKREAIISFEKNTDTRYFRFFKGGQELFSKKE